MHANKTHWQEKRHYAHNIIQKVYDLKNFYKIDQVLGLVCTEHIQSLRFMGGYRVAIAAPNLLRSHATQRGRVSSAEIGADTVS